jgi:hypothetical protein
MGTLRLRHCELLDAFGRTLVDNPDPSLSSRNKCVQSFVRTCAAVNYCPSTLPTLVGKQLEINEQPNDDTSPLSTLKNRIDLVWSLAILDLADATHVGAVLTQETFQSIQSSRIDTRPVRCHRWSNVF